MDQEPFYRNNPTNYQVAKDQFMDIIKHVGPHIHTLTVDTGDDRILDGYNMYTHEGSDGTELRQLSCNLVDDILSACPSLQELLIRRARFIDCRDSGPLHNNLKTISISPFSQFENGFLTILSACFPNLQNVSLGIDKKDINSDGVELYNIVMPFTNLNTLKLKLHLILMMIAPEQMKMSV